MLLILTFAGIRPSDVSLVYRGTDRGRLMRDFLVSLSFHQE